jgi:hypothetical protein
LLLILFMIKNVSANLSVKIVRLVAVSITDFHRTVVLNIYNTKIRTMPVYALDKNQEIKLTAFFLSLLNVSGVMPSMESRYCRGTWLNKSL